MESEEALFWDGENSLHLEERNAQRQEAGEHPITRAEVDALYDAGDFTIRDVEYLTSGGEWEWQVHLIGRTPAGRFLTVACQVSDDGRYRPITVWSSTGAERAMYLSDTGGGDHG